MRPQFAAAPPVHVLPVPDTDERVLPLIAALSAEYDARTAERKRIWTDAAFRRRGLREPLTRRSAARAAS